MKKNWKEKLYEVIYEADTPAGKWFDIVLLFLIFISILVVMLESVKSLDAQYHTELLTCEWIITILFSIEYLLRIICIKKPFKYIFSFYGIIDFFSTIPLYLSFFFVGSHVLVAFRALRLLRVFRILKLVRFLGEASQLKEALKASRLKITVFIYTVLILSVIMGTLMYLIEGAESGFTSIPRSIYWTIVTLTTVGYGDIAPATNLGQFIASLIMILGYGIIAVPTGIVTVEFSKQAQKINTNTQVCSNCHTNDHRDEAEFCYHCGEKL
ncbi:voltage-gated potassium channel [Pustulibacterium marinum]|uniref:Voltage-gated potassium channel n=1 Tax=Pustulibacterium marinum TaxID=1224947 RepID=A0A1I7IL39_9FLAO|nr:ion transporter [Pustulibacterium marinum]SFU73618.1 voltage-gated potassium channel [Pustulibacterium marinum]